MQNIGSQQPHADFYTTNKVSVQNMCQGKHTRKVKEKSWRRVAFEIPMKNPKSLSLRLPYDKRNAIFATEMI